MMWFLIQILVVSSKVIMLYWIALQSGVSGVFPQVALELLAGKVASTCGDVRRAIDIARRAVEIAEAQSPDAPLPLQPSADYGNVP